MNMAELIHELSCEGGVARLSLSGEINMRVASQLRTILLDVLKDKPEEEYIDAYSDFYDEILMQKVNED